MNHAACKLIIVTPVYEAAEASSRLFEEPAAEFKQDVFVVAVDDGSVRQPLEAGSLEISFGNFMALKPLAVKRLAAMQELSIHVAGSVLASRLRTAVCPLHRGPRYASQSKMNFVGLILHGFKALMVFAEDVLVRVGIACALTAEQRVDLAP